MVRLAVLENKSVKNELKRFYLDYTKNKTIQMKILAFLTSRSLAPNPIPRLGIALNMATSDWTVLLNTTGLYCLKSSDVKPLSCIILKTAIIACQKRCFFCQTKLRF